VVDVEIRRSMRRAGPGAAILALVLAQGASSGRLGAPLFLVPSVLVCAALAWRRERPAAVLAVVCVGVGVYLGAGNAYGPVLIAVATALFSVARLVGRRFAVCAAVAATLLVVGTVMAARASDPFSTDFLPVPWLALAVASGDAVRNKQAYLAEVEERAARAERTREEEALRRVAEERLRIARELHDVLGHHIALVSVQAGVAAHIIDAQPEQAKSALGHIQRASRAALDELRVTVGLLRRPEDAAPTDPLPGLGSLDELTGSCESTGLQVVTVTEGAVRQLPAAVDLTAYRVVQEALTNARKHAGPAAVEVRIGYGAERLRVTVRDHGRGAPPPDDAAPTGHGLVGMRERAAALGGTVVAGPHHDGGFQVHLELPIRQGEFAL
jgi:signal transduction histidine kinase